MKRSVILTDRLGPDILLKSLIVSRVPRQMLSVVFGLIKFNNF